MGKHGAAPHTSEYREDRKEVGGTRQKRSEKHRASKHAIDKHAIDKHAVDKHAVDKHAIDSGHALSHDPGQAR